jgi:hypothetical protein
LKCSSSATSRNSWAVGAPPNREAAIVADGVEMAVVMAATLY